MHEVWLWENILDKKEAGQDARSDEREDAVLGAREERAASGGAVKTRYVEEELLPCHYFDFMYGTSTGALSATLLGRLRMTIKETMQCYREVSNASFSGKRKVPLATKHHHADLVKVVQRLVGSKCTIHPACNGEDDSYSLEQKDSMVDMGFFDATSPRICQSCCLAVDDDSDSSKPYLFRTYHHVYGDNSPNWVTRFQEGDRNLDVWQVIQATCTTPFHFKPLKVEVDGKIRSFKSAGMNNNNPSGVALSEYHCLYESVVDEPALLLSIGTGRPDSSRDGYASQTSGLFSHIPLVGRVLQRIAHQSLPVRYTESEKQHLQMREHVGGEESWYKRLNVSHGLSEILVDHWTRGTWEGQTDVPGGRTMRRLEELTQAYLERDFDPSVDSYAPPKVMLRQTAQKLVRQRRAREHEGGVRWKTFVGKYLQKIPRRPPATSLTPQFQTGRPSQPEAILTQPSSAHCETQVHNPSITNDDRGPLNLTTASRQSIQSLDACGGASSIDDCPIEKDSTPSVKFPTSAPASESYICTDSLTSKHDPDVLDMLLESVLDPTATALQAESSCYESLTPLFSQLRCSQSMQSGDVWELSLSHTESTLRSIGDVLQAIHRTIESLCHAGLCGPNINVLIEDRFRDQTLSTVCVPCSEITLINNYARSAQKSENSDSDYSGLSRLTMTMLQRLQVETLRFSGSGWGILDQLFTLCLVLTASIISYAGSHCHELDERLVPPYVDHIIIGKARYENGKPLTLRRRELGCLATYIGAPVWSLCGSTVSNSKHDFKVSTTLAQFADLWGPVWTVPAPGQPGWLLAAHTESGILYQASTATSEETCSNTDVECHWAQAIFTQKSSTTSHAGRDSCFAILDPGYLDGLVPFDETARLLVGTSLHTQSLPHAGLRSHHLDSGYQTKTSLPIGRDFPRESNQHPGFTVNPSCGLHFRSFLRDNSYQIRMAGTAPARYLPDSYQANFTAGKYIGVGGSKTFRRRPASTMKQKVLEYCSKPFASLDQILELRIGLEVSACSENAQRISLWQTLLMAYGTNSTQPKICEHRSCDLACARDCWGLDVSIEASSPTSGISTPHKLPNGGWTKESRETISGLIGELSLTGLLDDQFHCLVPPCRVLARSTKPEWTTLLKDTDTSACFAILTDRCLMFDGRDFSDDSRRARKCCTGKRPPTVGPLLCTSILLKMNGQRMSSQQTLCRVTALTLELGQKIPVVAGYLVAKNDEQPLQLLSYHRQRFGPLTSKETEYREHFGADANQENIVRVSIM